MSRLCNLKLCATGNHSIFPMSRFNSQASEVWQKGIIGKTAAIWGSIEENMELGRKTAFLFGGRSELEVVNAALYENCCSLPQLSRQWDIVEQRGTEDKCVRIYHFRQPDPFSVHSMPSCLKISKSAAARVSQKHDSSRAIERAQKSKLLPGIWVFGLFHPPFPNNPWCTQ